MFFSDWFGPSVKQAAPGNARIALTFDDGPSESTPRVLDVLAEHGVHATFFLVGLNTERLPDIARRVVKEGHEIGNHTYSHANFYRRAPWQVASEIERCQRILEDRLGIAPRWFRPPYGCRWFGMFPALDRLKMRNAMWSVDTCDWRDPAAAIIERAQRLTGDGDVVLMHDGFRTHSGDHRKETAKALPVLLSHYRERGFATPTFSEMFSLTAGR
jgi:peptidoglycan/xylan/chitin deacetylase (PgdA/CDA1 family)